MQKATFCRYGKYVYWVFFSYLSKAIKNYYLIFEKVFTNFKNTKYLAKIGINFPVKWPEKTQYQISFDVAFSFSN